jgi:hypothetical protein
MTKPFVNSAKFEWNKTMIETLVNIVKYVWIWTMIEGVTTQFTCNMKEEGKFTMFQANKFKGLVNYHSTSTILA